MPRKKKSRAAEPIPEAEEAPPRADAHAGARHAGAHAPPRTRTRGRTSGPTVTHRIDEDAAENLKTFRKAFGSAQAIDIERIRPRWCSGWLEKIPVQVTQLGELREYIQEVWGGHVYKITVLGLDEAPLAWHEIRIGAPPREDGQLITREAFEGSTPAATAAPVAQSGNADMLAMCKLVLDESRESRNQVIKSVEEIQKSGVSSVADMLSRLDTREKSASLGEQLKELRDGSRAIREVTQELVAEADADRPESQDDEMQGVIAHAGKRFVDAMADDMEASAREKSNGKQPESGPQKRQRPQQGRQSIPEAK